MSINSVFDFIVDNSETLEWIWAVLKSTHQSCLSVEGPGHGCQGRVADGTNASRSALEGRTVVRSDQANHCAAFAQSRPPLTSRSRRGARSGETQRPAEGCG